MARKVASKDELDGPVNEELKALEAHMLSVTKAGECSIRIVNQFCKIQISSQIFVEHSL